MRESTAWEPSVRGLCPVCTPSMWGALGTVGFAGLVGLGVGAGVSCSGHCSSLFPDAMEVLLILLCGLLAPTVLASGEFARDQLRTRRCGLFCSGGRSWLLGSGVGALRVPASGPPCPLSQQRKSWEAQRFLWRPPSLPLPGSRRLCL